MSSVASNIASSAASLTVANDSSSSAVALDFEERDSRLGYRIILK